MHLAFLIIIGVVATVVITLILIPIRRIHSTYIYPKPVQDKQVPIEQQMFSPEEVAWMKAGHHAVRRG